MTLTHHSDVTYRIHYTTQQGTDYTGMEHHSLTAADTIATRVLHNYPAVVRAEVECWCSGKKSHVLIRKYRIEQQKQTA